jgi:hypothetical protein
MPKIIHAQSGPQPPDPETQPASIRPDRIEIVVTPTPKIRKERQANAKAKNNQQAYERQQANAYAPDKQSETQRTARRKRARDKYHDAVRADLAAGKITEEQAKERLTKRRKPDIGDA